MSYTRLWIALGAVLLISFAILAGVGLEIHSSAPPMAIEELEQLAAKAAQGGHVSELIPQERRGED
jgi:nitric oxide reductase large subunit